MPKAQKPEPIGGRIRLRLERIEKEVARLKLDFLQLLGTEPTESWITQRVTTVEQLGLSRPTLNALRRNFGSGFGDTPIEWLLGKTASEVLRLRGLGHIRLLEIERALSGYSLALKDTEILAG